MLSAQHRVTAGSDYRAIVREGTRLQSTGVTLHIVKTESSAPARFGFIVTKSVGKAHDRNTLRRRLKAVGARLIQSGLTGVDVVIRPREQTLTMPFSELVTTIVKPMTERGFLSEAANV